MNPFSDFLENNSKGLYIDIGAGTPKEQNYTKILYKRNWKGLLVEPNPILASMLAKDRPKDVMYKGAILNYTGNIVLSTKNIYGIDLSSWIYRAHKALSKGEVFCAQDFQVRCTTFEKLIRKHPEFISANLLSIDVDGNENEIISTIDFEVFKPKLIVIQHKKKDLGYHKIWGTTLNLYYDLVKENLTTFFYKKK
jgi:FkbM family methyltransferase